MAEELLWSGDGKEAPGTCPDLGSSHQVAIVTVSQDDHLLREERSLELWWEILCSQRSRGRVSSLHFTSFPPVLRIEGISQIPRVPRAGL